MKRPRKKSTRRRKPAAPHPSPEMPVLPASQPTGPIGAGIAAIQRVVTNDNFFHQSVGMGVLSAAALLAPRVIAVLRASRKAWSAPDASSRRRARSLAKAWGLHA